MTTERNAQKVPTNNAKGLAEVLGLLGKATPGEWETWGEPTHDDPSVKLAAGYSFVATTLAGNDLNNATAIAAAVNYLRSHGAAIAELIAAAREASATLGNAYHTVLTGELAEHAHADYQRLDAALRQVEGQ